MNNTTNYQDNHEYALTAIVLVYNGEPYLKDCINSLVNQTLDNLEILLINDASTDDSLSICLEFDSSYDNIHLINKEENEGLTSSANLGISLAKGEYIILVDNDDIIPPYAYEKLYNKAKQNNADICTAKANFLRENTQFEFDYRENYVWRKEQIITDINEFPELFEDSYYWNKIIRKELLIKNNIKLPDGMIYADRYFAHKAFMHANKIAIIPDCVYLWRQIKSSLSQQRRDTDNYINRLDSYDLDLEFFNKNLPTYFKLLLRRIMVPIRGILNNKEFEDVVFNRVQPLIKRHEKKFYNLYDNDLNLIDNIGAYLISNNYKSELIKLLQSDLKEQREIYEENETSYWKLPLFRNPMVYIPDELFKIKRLANQFVTIDEITVTEDKIKFSNIKIPKYVPIKKLQIVLTGLTDEYNVYEENTLTFDLKTNENIDNLSYNLEISSDELANFEIYHVFLKVIYNDNKSNKLRINKMSIEKINNTVNNMIFLINTPGDASLLTQNLNKSFRINSDENKLNIIINDNIKIKRNLRMFIRKSSTKEIVYLNLNESKTAFEAEWEYFLDSRSSYSLFLRIYNDKGQLRRDVPLNEKYLENFYDKFLKIDNLNVKIFKNKNNNIEIKSFQYNF